MSQQADIQRSRRQKSAAPGGMHDRLIRFLRVALPSVIGAIAALLVFSPFSNTREMSFVLAKDEVNKAQERMKVTNAFYRGEDSEGRPFALRAGSAVQKSSEEPILKMSSLSGQIMLEDGPTRIEAAHGAYDMDKETVRTIGPLALRNGKGFTLNASNVVLFMKTRIVESLGLATFSNGAGFTLSASNARVLLKNKTMESSGPVNGATRVGTFSAGKMRADLNSRIVRLENGANLRINQGAIR
jgi:lipopolysaccharide export system protein LptC